MAKNSSHLSQALSLCSYVKTPPPKLQSRKIRFNHLPAANPLDERSPNAQSQPVKIPGREPALQTLPAGWKPAPAKAHHKLDSIVDYCLPGSNGWEAAQQERVVRNERDIGRISKGAWPPRDKFDPVPVVRKDVGFGDEERVMRDGYWDGETVCGGDDSGYSSSKESWYKQYWSPIC